MNLLICMESKVIRIAQVVGKMNAAGVESVVMNYYKNIDRKKIQFDFIVDIDSTYIPKDTIESLGGRVYIVPPYQKLFKYMKVLIKLFKENNYYIVHSHINTLSIFPLCAAKIAKIKVRIAHSHSSAGGKEIKRNIIKYILKPFSKIFSTEFLACSELAGEWLFGKKFMNSGKVIILKNAIDTSKFSYNQEIRDYIRKKEDLTGKFVIGHVGRFVNQKNHVFLLKIFYEIHKYEKDAILLLIGDGNLRQLIEEKVKLLSLDDSVKFLGIKENVNEYMQAMDVFLLPSFYEGLPVVGVEAQTSGLCCIFSNNITREVKLTQNVIYLGLDEGEKKWAKVVLDHKDFDRKNMDYIISESGFDIKNEAKKLENYYLQFIRERYGTN